MVLAADELRVLQLQVTQVHLGDKVVDYVLALAARTRQGEEFQLGVSTRGALGLCRAAKAMAFAEGRDYVVPDDVQRLAVPVLAHRVVLRRGSTGLEASRRAVEQVVAATPVPV